ncbi:unnamed protein product, partial [Mesorhabditis belari]|uniref:Cytochrome c oxidase assembly protein COX11, mitochondrial n=1 Tax=Mesorhabditis belari TaxID=2138241 RepID=A0AAF3FND3_9BILA
MKSNKVSSQSKSIKIVVRGFPPSIDEDSTRQQLGTLPAEPVYWRFSPGNPHLDCAVRPFLIIAFANDEDAVNFADRFHGFVFVDSKGAASSVFVELALNVSIPKTTRETVNKDPEIGKVNETNEFKQYVENIKDTSTRLSIDQQLKIIDEKRSKLVVGEITPLAKFVLQQHIQKRDRIEERRKVKEEEHKTRKEKRAARLEKEEKELDGRAKGQKLLGFMKREPKEENETKLENISKREVRSKWGASNASSSNAAGKVVKNSDHRASTKKNPNETIAKVNVVTKKRMQAGKIRAIQTVVFKTRRTSPKRSLIKELAVNGNHELSERSIDLEGNVPSKKGSRDMLYYAMSLGVVAIGATFAAIPLYRIFCEQTSFGGLTQIAKDFAKIATMQKVEDRLIRVQFNSDVPSNMRWEFKPVQDEIYVHPGETALAFFLSSYNLVPFQAAYYFNKIQCFCFEEQILNPGEQVDLPVFFYIDPDYANDPNLEFLDSILLSYTFFEAKSGLKLPSPFEPKPEATNVK